MRPTLLSGGAAVYVIANRRTGQTLTSTTDPYRARLLACGFEQYSARGAVRPDIGGVNHYCHVGRLRMGQPHPYEAGARRLLDAERDALARGVVERLAGRLP
jgi:hypothetical protein